MRLIKKCLILVYLLFYILVPDVMAENKQEEKTEPLKKDITKTAEFKEKLREEVIRVLKRVQSDNLVKLSQELLDKENALIQKEVSLKNKEEQIDINQTHLEKKIEEFEKTQQKVLGCIETNKKNKDKRIRHIVKVISGMRPKNAADVLSVQDADIAVEILGKIEPERASKIFNLMEKEISARIQKQYLSMKK